MPEPVKTSFIPKASLAERPRKERAGTGPNLLELIGTILLVVAVAGAAGTFLFEQFTKTQITAKKESLDRARAAFEPATIQELLLLDKRLSSATALLSTHTAPSRLFEVIEGATLSSVRFGDFSLSESDTGTLTLTMKGQAASFNAVALQSDAFGKTGIFSNPIFGGLNLDDKGTAVFTFSAVVNTEALAYQPRTTGSVPSTNGSTTP